MLSQHAITCSKRTELCTVYLVHTCIAQQSEGTSPEPLHSSTANGYTAVTAVYSPTPAGTFLTDMFEATARKQQQQQQQQCGSAGATDSADGYSDEQQQLCELQQTVSSMRAQCMRTLGTAAMDEV
jgi:hypothetical protein